MSLFFNLDAPPGFCGLDPDRSVQMYQRNLPHWRQDGATYFITFRLADSLPQNKLDELKVAKKQWQEEFDEKRMRGALSENETNKYQDAFGRIQFRKMEFWLDQGMGACILRDRKFRKILIGALEHFEGERYELCSYVIMPNHVHLLIKPLPGNTLETILQSRKRNSALEVNKMINKQGAVWRAESFDRIVRDAEHLWRCLQYIGRNPGKGNLGKNEYTRWVKAEWRILGWDFLE